MENKAAQFLERYREIEEWVLNNLNISEMKELEQMPQYKGIRSIFCSLCVNFDWHIRYVCYYFLFSYICISLRLF